MCNVTVKWLLSYCGRELGHDYRIRRRCRRNTEVSGVEVACSGPSLSTWSVRQAYFDVRVGNRSQAWFPIMSHNTSTKTVQISPMGE